MKRTRYLPNGSFWAKQPMARYATLFSLGCLLGRIVLGPCIQFGWFAALLLFAWIFCIIQFRNTLGISKWKQHFLMRGASISVFVLVSGILMAMLTLPDHQIHASVASRLGKSSAYLIEVISEPRLKSDKLTVDCKLIQEILPQRNFPLYGTVRVQIYGGLPVNVQLNSQLVVFGRLTEPQYSRIPGDFDYHGFLESKGIFAQIRVDTSSVFHLSQTVNSIQRIAFKWRGALLKRFSNQILQPDEMQVASALLLGDRTEMSSNLLKEYSSGGIIHILAVSGLHVGLIYQALVFLMGFIPFLKKFKLDLFLIILLLWIYATMTGLSPSVNRAVCMFTLIAFAGILNRKVSPFNMLGSAAFILLLISPGAIVDMGFQLSFAAVWGILSTRPVLDMVQLIHSKFLRFISGPIIISIAAQLATAPVALFAFGTFPVWFLPANLIAVPLSTLLTYLGLVTLIVSDIPFLGNGLMTLFAWGLKLLNAWARLIGGLPWAKLDNVYIHGFEFFFFSISIIGFFSMLLSRSKFKYILILMSLLAGFSVGGMFNWFSNHAAKSMIYCSSTMLHLHHVDRDTIHHSILLSGQHLLEEPHRFQLDLSEALQSGRPVIIHTAISVQFQPRNYSGVYCSDGHLWKMVDVPTDLNRLESNACLVIVDFNPKTLQLLKDGDIKQRYIIPAPWLSFKQRKLLLQTAIQLNWNMKDPKKSGWFYLN